MQMTLSVSQIPFEVDVWNVIESELMTGLQDVLDLKFHYSVEKGKGKVKISHPKDSRITTKHIELGKEEAEDLIMVLANQFNFHWSNIVELSFELKPGELPIFTTKIYPVVSDESMLDRMKSRMSPITID